MKRTVASLRVGLLAFLAVFMAIPALASATPSPLATPPGLNLAEIKITGSEFVMLQNNTGATISSTELSNYWLYDFNGSDPTAVGVSSSTQQLPAAALAAGQTVLLSADGGATCGAALTSKLSISLTDTAGFLEVVHTSFSGGVLTQTAGDSVSWGSSTNGASLAAANITVPTNTTAKVTYADYRVLNTASPATFWWQPANTTSTACQLTVASATVDTSSINQLLPGTPPPATFVTTGSQSSGSTASLPADDIGLSGPIVNEILPNPAEPQSDDEDEFIEIYNSNDGEFDLGGFMLAVGTSTIHYYTFADGTFLAPHSFTTFYSIDTGLAMSNSGGQVKLLDPGGNLVTQTDSYGTAKDGQAWALANGAWYWTTTPTPDAANVISQPLTVKALSVGTTKKTATSSPKITKAAKTSSKKSTTSNPASANGSSAAAAAPIHPWTLAGVGSAALIYAGYEYRADLANNFYKFRRYIKAWRATRK